MLCSLCIYQCNEANSISLFGAEGETWHWKMIAKHMEIELPCGEDTESKMICKDCAHHLDEFCNFCKYIEERQRFLMTTTLDHGEVPIEESTLVDLYKADEDLVIGEAICVEGKSQLPLVKDEIVMDEKCYSRTTSNKDSDEFPVSIADGFVDDSDLDQDDSSVNPFNDEDWEETKSEEFTGKPKKVHKTKRLKKEPKTRTRKSRSRDDNSNSKDDSDTKRSQHIAMTDELIAQNSSLRCEVCGAIEETFVKLKSHYRSLHGMKGYVKCCGRIFSRRHHLCEHLNLHLNPSLYKCQICEKNLKTAYSYQKHMQDVHPKEEDLKFECEICGKKTASKLSAQLHREKHEGAKHICHQCDKRFMTKYSLEYHVKTIHERQNNPYVCETCGREYKSKSCFTVHIAEHQGVVPKKLVQCLICKDWVKRLDQHMQKHNHVDVECKICGKVAASKSSLRSHIEKTHRNIVELPCSFCSKIFKSKKSLKEHISMHTNTKDYRCQYCDREFRSSANMYAHIKRDHVEQWSQAKKDRKKAPSDEDMNQEAIVQSNIVVS